MLDPSIDALVEITAAAAGQEFDPQLLEIACEAGGEQPLPLVARHEAVDLLLRPIEAERLAETGVGAGDDQLVDLMTQLDG